MPLEPTQEAVVRLPVAEWNEMLTQMQRSIAWSQQILAKVVIQLQQQQPTNAQSPEQGQPVEPSQPVVQLGREGRRPRSVDGSNPAA